MEGNLPPVLRVILKHLGLPADSPPIAPAPTVPLIGPGLRRLAALRAEITNPPLRRARLMEKLFLTPYGSSCDAFVDQNGGEAADQEDDQEDQQAPEGGVEELGADAVELSGAGFPGRGFEECGQ